MTQQGSGVNTLWEGVLSAIQTPGRARPKEPFSEVLQRVVYRHISAEESSIERYRKLLDEAKDPVVRVLLGELLHDEQEHHAILLRMEAQLRAELGEQLEGPFSGEPGAMTAKERKATVAELKDLATHENAGVKHLKEVAKESREAGSDVLGLLLECVAADSAKHERILKFIAKRVAEA